MVQLSRRSITWLVVISSNAIGTEMRLLEVKISIFRLAEKKNLEIIRVGVGGGCRDLVFWAEMWLKICPDLV